MRFPFSKKTLFFPAVLLGIAALVISVKTRQEPRQTKLEERSRAVRVIPAPELAVSPRAVGYGIAEPGKVWEGVAQVGGKIVEIHPDLKNGALFAKGTVLLRIDPEEYGLARNRGAADVRNIQAQLDELARREQNLRRSLEVETKSLGLSRKELERRRRLVDQGTLSPSEYDQEEKRYLSQLNVVQNLRNSLNLIPAERAALRAKLSAQRSGLRVTELDLDRTTVVAPFDCRISRVNVERDQVASPGQVLVKADSINVSEIPAQMPVHEFRRLIGRFTVPPLAGEGFSNETVRQLVGLKATVRVRISGRPVVWDARFVRLSDTVDPATRTIGVYVAVDEPYRRARPSDRPPLVKNMYCEVELQGEPLPPAVVLPRSAVHDGKVYVADEENRLRIVPVNVAFTQGNIAVLNDGLEPGTNIVVTDLIPAIEGMLLAPGTDGELLMRLKAEALGRAEEDE